MVTAHDIDVDVAPDAAVHHVPSPPAPPGPPRRRRASHLGWGFADQAMSSLSTFVLTVTVARAVGAAPFGAFALALSAYLLTTGVARAMVAEPFAVRWGRDGRADRSAALGAALSLGVGAGLVSGAVGLAVGGAIRTPMLVVGALMPALVQQDAVRCVLLSSGRARAAFANDLVWVVVQVVGVGTLVLTDTLSVASGLAVWGVGAVIGALLGIAQTGWRPRPRRTLTWLRDTRTMWPSFLGEHLAALGAWQIALVVLGALVGLDAVAATRGAQTLLGPVTIAYYAAPTILIAEMARGATGPGGPAGVRRRAATVSGLFFGIGIVATAGMLVLPDRWGAAVLGPTWSHTGPIIGWMGLYTALTGVNLGAVIGLRALAATRQSSRARAIASTAMVTASVVGGLVAGAEGFAVGAVGATGVGTVLWWRALRSVTEVRDDGESDTWA